jgi:hypothetical protein
MRLLVVENNPALATFLHNSFDAEHYAVEARATGIIKLLITRYLVAPNWLSASGYGEYYSVASNERAEGCAMHRRVDLVILNSNVEPVAPPMPVVITDRRKPLSLRENPRFPFIWNRLDGPIRARVPVWLRAATGRPAAVTVELTSQAPQLSPAQSFLRRLLSLRSRRVSCLRGRKCR